MTPRKRTFGEVLRETREGRFSVRKFAELSGVSPTYLSQVEKGNVAPPTAERVKVMAELLDADPDEWTLLAGRLPTDLTEIIMQHPNRMPELIREAGELDDQQFDKIRQLIAAMHHQ
jgi:transcriptional regulator with XRE-family HTH domain